MSRMLLIWVGVMTFASADLFEDWDRNGDGKLAREELPNGPRRNFGRVDTDRSGFISRAEHEAFLKRRKPGAGRAASDEDLRVVRDLDYVGAGNPRQKLDLFLPKAEAAKPRPLVVFIHGGGWRKGSKEGGLGRLRGLLEGGEYAGASINYRLTDEAMWPAQLHDCKAAIRWLRAHAGEYGYDSEKIAVWGTSAGGHLVAALGVTGDVPELEGDLGEHDGVSSAVACVVDYFGPTELLTMDDHGSTMNHSAPDSPESKLLGGPLQEMKAKARNASPITHVSKPDAPILIAHGTKDPLVSYPQSVAFAGKLKEAGVPVYLVKMIDAGHGFRSEELDRRVAAFLGWYLLGNDTEVDTTPIPAGK